MTAATSKVSRKSSSYGNVTKASSGSILGSSYRSSHGSNSGSESLDGLDLSINKFMNLIGIFVISSCVFTAGFFSGKIWGGVGDTVMPDVFEILGKNSESEMTELDFDLFWEVWNTLDTQYVEKDINDEDLYYGSIKGLVSGVGDPVTVFLTPDETLEYEKGNAGKFEGIGIEIGYENGHLIVVAPLEGSPAHQAGLMAGDKILKVDGEDIVGENIFKVVSKIRGDKGTDVVLTVMHKAGVEMVDITVTRGEISVSSVTFDGIESDVAIIDLDRFTEASMGAWTSNWDCVIDEVKAENPKAIIIDMRGNPGGYFNAAVWAAGDFLEKGSLVAKQRNRNGVEFDFNVERGGSFLDIPMVVLVDGGSASASEILAGALQFYGRAYIIGESTYGKGTAQEIVEYSDGSSLHITTLKWVLPDGKALCKERVIQPDKVVEYSEEAFENGDDPQMEEAIEYLNSRM